jgi:speckle-type POZ protein
MVRRMVDYLYTGNYAEQITATGINGQTEGISTLRVHAMVFALGDKYLIEGLLALSTANYSRALGRESNVRNFLRTLPDVYTLTPDSSRGLRDKAIKFAKEKLIVSLASPETKDIYENVAANIPEFIKELLDSFLQQPPLVRRYNKCFDCILASL